MTILVINNYRDEEDLPRARKTEEVLEKEGKSGVIIWHFSEIGSREIPKDLEAIILSGSRALKWFLFALHDLGTALGFMSVLYF
jgi:hypothetical protein